MSGDAADEGCAPLRVLFPFLARARERAAATDRAPAPEELPEWRAPYVRPVEFDEDELEGDGTPPDLDDARDEDDADDDAPDDATDTVEMPRPVPTRVTPVARAARAPRRPHAAPPSEPPPVVTAVAVAPRPPPASPRVRKSRKPAAAAREAARETECHEAPPASPELTTAVEAPPPTVDDEPVAPAPTQADGTPHAWPLVPLAPPLDDPASPYAAPDHPLRLVDPSRARIRLCVRHTYPAGTFEMDADLYPLDTTLEAIAAQWGGLRFGDCYTAVLVELGDGGDVRRDWFGTVFTAQAAPSTQHPIRPWRLRAPPDGELPTSLVDRLRSRERLAGELVEWQRPDPTTARGRQRILDDIDASRPVGAEVARLARLHEVPAVAINRWRREYARGGLSALAPKRRGRRPRAATVGAPDAAADPEALLARAGRYIARMERVGFGPGTPEPDMVRLERLLELAPRLGGLEALLVVAQGLARARRGSS